MDRNWTCSYPILQRDESAGYLARCSPFQKLGSTLGFICRGDLIHYHRIVSSLLLKRRLLTPWYSFSGWTTLKPFSASDFFSTYINIPLFFLLFVFWKFYKKTTFVKLHEMDVTTHYVEGSVVKSKLVWWWKRFASGIGWECKGFLVMLLTTMWNEVENEFQFVFYNLL